MLEIARWHFCAHSLLLQIFCRLIRFTWGSHDSKSIKRWLLIPFIIYARCLIEKYGYESLRLVNVSKLSLHKFIGLDTNRLATAVFFSFREDRLINLASTRRIRSTGSIKLFQIFLLFCWFFLFSSNRKIKCHLNNTTTYMHVAVINYTHFDAVWLCMFAFRNVKFEISIIGLCARYRFFCCCC